MAKKVVYAIVKMTFDADWNERDEDGFEHRTPTVQQVKNYIGDAVAAWGGQYRPEDPFFGTNKSSVVVWAGLKEPTARRDG